MSNLNPTSLRKFVQRTIALSLRTKMLTLFGGLFAATYLTGVVVNLYGLPFTSLKGEYAMQQEEAFLNLNMVADMKKERLLRWIDERKGDVSIFANSQVLFEDVKQLRARIHDEKSRSASDAYAWRNVERSPVYRNLVSRLAELQSTYKVYGSISVVDRAARQVIASTDPGELGSFCEEPYVADQRTLDLLDDTYIRDVTRNRQGISTMQFVHLIAGDASHSVPKETSSAVLVVDVVPNKTVKQILHTGGGLGQTGEVLLVNHDSEILTQLKHLLADGSEPAVLDYKIEALAATLAAQGKEGLITSLDYRGEPVLAAYRHLRISPEIGWGMVTKIDDSEVFANLGKTVERTIFVGLVGILFAFFAIMLISRQLAGPIRELSDLALTVESGDLSARFSGRARGEVGILATTFNSMIAQIQSSQQQLERLVEERTVELRVKNEDLENEIFERKQAEKLVQHSNEELRRSNQDLEQFAYVASHDLQEPLRMISSYTQLLERRYKDKLDQDANDFIHFAVDGASRMQNLINDLLEYSRISTRGKLPEKVDSHAVLGQAIANLQSQIAKTGAMVTNDDMPEIEADESQLMRVFQNLIGNAIKFHGDNTPHVHVSVQEKGKEWVFAVRDNGIGIDEKYRERAFTIFQRLQGKTDYPGTGIGLAICKRVVSRHGGRIWFESKPGEGTTFYFTLPITRRPL